MSPSGEITGNDRGIVGSPEDVVRFYQRLGFFTGADPRSIVQRYTEAHRHPPDTSEPWDDAYLLADAESDVWYGDPEADVCSETHVYCEVLLEWAGISRGTFAPTDITEHWESETGPVTVTFQHDGRFVSISPKYDNDWMDMEVLRQINALIAPSERQFECAVDANFAVVLSLTPEQKKAMQTERRFPFAW